MKNFFFLILGFVLPLTVLSQKGPEASYIIKGQIADSVSQSSIPYATITIMKSPENSVEKRIATDADGKFEASLKGTGNYLLIANSLGYTSTKRLFTVENNKTLDLGKLILKQSSVELGEVQVIGEKPLIKVESDKLSYNAESDPDTKTSNALDLLRKVPLVTVDGEDNVQLKGSSNYKVFVNGKPSTMATNNTKDFLKNMPASSIKNIEVITSPGAKYDAEGVGGIINIITQKKTLNGYTCSVNAGVNTLGAVNGGFSYSATMGKLGVSTSLYDYYQDNPYYKSTSNTIDNSSYTTISNGRSKYRGMSPWGEGELSYEIDTLNLINVTFSLWYAQNTNLSRTRTSVSDSTLKVYDMAGKNKYTYGEPEGSFDYQHTSKHNKEQIFTLSYKVNYNPTGNDGESDINNVQNYIDSWRKSDNSAYSVEHTFQTDFVKPIVYNYKLEMGLKYILRNNNSTTDAYYYDFVNSKFVFDPTKINNFDYTQNIYAAYLSVNKNIKKFGFKAGLRVEDVNTDGTFTSSTYSNFKNTNFEYVPSATISYQISESNNLRLSYSKRIQRPDIWYLNPFVNDLDPKNVSYGNPNLDPERFHNLELNFGSFSKMGNVNITLFNSFSNNGIDRYTDLKNGVHITSYGNIDKIQTWGISTFASIRIGKKLSTSINSSINYNSIESSDSTNLKSNGWGYNIYGNLQYTIGKGYKVSGYGMYFKRSAQLQTKMSAFYNMGVSFSKSMLKDKLVLSISARNIFWDKMKYSYKIEGPLYSQEYEMYRPGRSFGFNISYRFGEMNSQLKKTQRGIQNDDLKKGEGGNSSGS